MMNVLIPIKKIESLEIENNTFKGKLETVKQQKKRKKGMSKINEQAVKKVRIRNRFQEERQKTSTESRTVKIQSEN